MFQSAFQKEMAVATWQFPHLPTSRVENYPHLHTHQHTCMKYSSFLFTNSGNNFYSKLDLC